MDPLRKLAAMCISVDALSITPLALWIKPHLSIIARLRAWSGDGRCGGKPERIQIFDLPLKREDRGENCQSGVRSDGLA
jgi:hypothetical protein